MRYWAVSMGEWGEENFLTIVVVRRKMVHISDKHQPNCLNLQDIGFVS